MFKTFNNYAHLLVFVLLLSVTSSDSKHTLVVAS